MEAKSITGRRGLNVDYDEDADVLYVAISKPQSADTFDAGHGLLLRKNPLTKEIIGVTILHYDLFRKLRDLSWLDELDLPPKLRDYLLERP